MDRNTRRQPVNRRRRGTNPITSTMSRMRGIFSNKKVAITTALVGILVLIVVVLASLLGPKIGQAWSEASSALNAALPSATNNAEGAELPADQVASPAPSPTSTPKKESKKDSKKKEEKEKAEEVEDLTKIEATDRWNADGTATEAEQLAQAQAKSDMVFGMVSPEQVAETSAQLHSISASNTLSDKEKKKLTKEVLADAELEIVSAFEDQVRNNALFTNQALRDVAGTYVRAFLYGFERYDDAMSAVAQAEGAALYNDSVSIPFQTNPEEDPETFLWELAQRIVRDPVYADMWCQTFDELYMYDYNVESETWELVSVGKVVNPLIHSFAQDNKSELKKWKNEESEGPWYQLRLKGYGDEVVVDPESFKVMCLFGMMTKSLTYLGTTQDTPAVYWALNRTGVPDAVRRTAKRTDGNPETKPWAKLGFVRKEESAVGAGLVEYEVWVNLMDGRTGIPGEPTVPNTAPPVPVRPDNPYVPTATPTPEPVPTTPPQGNPNPTATPIPTTPPSVVVTATPVPTTPPQGDPTPTPVVVTPTPEPTATPIPLKDPTDYNPGYNQEDEGQVIDQEDEEERYTSPEQQEEEADPWNPGAPDDSYVAPTVIPDVVQVTTAPQREEVTDSVNDYQTDNDGTNGDTEHYSQDEDGYWDAAPGTYSEPEDCNNNGSTADEEANAVDDTAGHTYQPVEDTSGSGWTDVPTDGALDGAGVETEYVDYGI